MTFTIEELQIPDSLDGEGSQTFREFATVRNMVESHTLGTDLLAMALPEILSEYRSNPHRVRRHFFVRRGGAVVARGMVTHRPHTPETGAYLMVDVLPERRSHDIGTALLQHVERVAVDVGAPVLKVAVPHAPTPGGARIAPPTGFGDVRADDDGARFLRAHGFVLEQVNRISLLDTAGLSERLVPLRAAAESAAGEQYRLTTWIGPTPPRWLDDVVELRTRMSTDAPMAGMVMTLDRWDVDRVHEHDDRMVESGRTVVTAAVEHVGSGTLAGFSEVIVSPHDAVGVQEDTLVLRDHRGHRLGMLLKAATAEAVLAAAPWVEAVVTWNAEENRPMLDVNEAMGFRAIGYEGAWQKRVVSASE